MAYENNQNENPLPTGKNGETRKASQFLPRYFRTVANEKFVSSTLDQLISSGTVEKINGYIGRRDAKAFQSTDSYINDVSDLRQNYQLEPALVIDDNIGNTKFYKDYQDFVNQTKVFGGNTKDHSKLNSQEYYAWDPHVDWDKFSNFREYYWLPEGPQTLTVLGQAKGITSTYKVTVEDQGDNMAFVFTPDGKTANPTLKLYKGQTYRFVVDTPGHPIAFATNRVFTPGAAIVTETVEGVLAPGKYDSKIYDSANFDQDGFLVDPVEGGIEGYEPGKNISTLYNKGVTTSDGVVYVEKGVLEFTIPDDAPTKLFYISKNDVNTSGSANIYNIDENTAIDVEAEIIGKQTYTTEAGVSFTNGMKIRFAGEVTPAKYDNKEFYVEGVGEEIQLVDEVDLEIPSSSTESKQVPFDTESFDRVPFSNANNYPTVKEYIVFNRASPDRNQWARFNRWFHKDVISRIATATGTPEILDQSARATRPIIEFEAGVKLWNFGTEAKANVDLIDDKTKDVMSTIEGSVGYNVDGIDLVEGMRVLFTADTDSFVKDKIFKVKFLRHRNETFINLKEETDATPNANETVLSTNGTKYKGKMFWYNGTTWIQGQDKATSNSAPTFDLFDETGNSFTTYTNTNFTGTKLFSYKIGTGAVDPELGFALSYQNVQNTGDIVFNFNLLNDSFTYNLSGVTKTVKTDTSVLRKYTDRTTYTSVTGWKKADNLSKQEVVRQYDTSVKTNDFPVDVYDFSGDLNALTVKVYLNGQRKTELTDYEINRINRIAYVTFTKKITNGDKLVIKTTSEADKNTNGYYEFPSNLESNPQNANINEFTLGEVNDHVQSIVDNVPGFSGTNPGVNNLRDLGLTSKYGTKFLQHSGPMNLALYHMTDKDANIIKALKFAKREYSKFKRNFVKTAEDLGFEGPAKVHVDKILAKMHSENTKDNAFYFSDMLGSSDTTKKEYTVVDADNQFYAISFVHNLTDLTNKAVYVYLNGKQLVHGTDYTFTTQGFVQITATLALKDTIEIFEYNTTDGCYIPQTPTKLGLYPAYEPCKYNDNTYQTAVDVIQGHDGSITKAYGDFRDDVLLELEKRIYNNIKVPYDKNIVDIHSFVGTYDRNTGFTKESIDEGMMAEFIQWLEVVGSIDYTSNEFYDNPNTFTWNYGAMTNADGQKLPGFWRAVYKQWLDTDRPHTHPWEVLGYNIKPSWWETTYGPAPYTNENRILWDDLTAGRIREPNKTIVYNNNYKRKDLNKNIPVDSQGNLLSPNDCGYAQNVVVPLTSNNFVFGDEAPTETAWRKSSDYPFALMIAWCLNQPTKIIGLGFDRARTKRNSANEIVYSETNKRIALGDLVYPNTATDTTRSQTAGFINYIFDYLYGSITTTIQDYKDNIANLQNKLGCKLGGFTQKDKFKLVLDSRTPTNEGNVFVPEENYKVIFNTSSPIDAVSYSGIIVEKAKGGYIIKGYDNTMPSFKYFKHIEVASDPSVTVGAVSENFVTFQAGQTYTAGNIVQIGQEFYRAKVTHTAESFIEDNWFPLPELPSTGGRTAIFRSSFEDTESKLGYGTTLLTIQDVVDFLLGYGKYQESIGFTFNSFNRTLEQVENWELTTREFLFWTTQNWQEGALITLSPSAQELNFSRDYAVVDDIFDPFYDYSLLKADGKKLKRNFSTTKRDSLNEFGLQVKNSADGIYHIKLPLVQREHVLIIDNKTVFNDIIYDIAPGYRQERIKVLGYRTEKWTGGLNIPGFIYDSATCTQWEAWTDYAIGDIVQHKTFYYVANKKVAGKETFDDADWNVLPAKPDSKLIPNFEYKTNQFADFYDLDTDNFDSEQQRLAQHLIGYQKRQYIENIINDDVSQYKFYQGMIQDKGTSNALTKMFDALSSANKDSLEFHEEWAIKRGQYGASEGFEEVEFILDESKFRLSPQPVELVNFVDPTKTDLIIRQVPTDVYLKPKGYNHKPFPTKYFGEGYIKTAGYVNEEDVNYKVTNYDDILNLDPVNVNVNEYVWVAKDDTTWNVYKYVRTLLKVLELSTDTDGVTSIKCVTAPNVKKGEIVGIGNVTGQEKFYKVESVSLDTIKAKASTPPTDDVSNALGYLTKFELARLPNLVEANNFVGAKEIETGSTVWIDDDDTGRWIVLKNTGGFDLKHNIYNDSSNYIQNKELNFGSNVHADENNQTLAVGSPDINGRGKVHVYFRGSENVNFTITQTLLEPEFFADANSGFGTAVHISQDGEYLMVGAPFASNVRHQYKGQFNGATTYGKGDIVKWQEQLWKATAIILPADDSIDYNSFRSSAQGHQAIKDANTAGTYIDIKHIVTGNYGLVSAATDHILIRAPKNQYRGTQIGDVLHTKWNRLTTRFPQGKDPFNNDTVLNASFFTGSHAITEKIDEILVVPSTQSGVTIGDIVETDVARGKVVYTFTNADNESVIYVNDTNGTFAATGNLYFGNILVGAYNLPIIENHAYYEGWWKVQIGQTITPTTTEETYYGLVIKDIVKLNEVRTPDIYTNILDNRAVDVATANTKSSQIETVSHTGVSGAVVDNRVFVRSSKAFSDSINVGEKFNVWLNSIPLSDGTIQNPSAIGIDWETLNFNEFTVSDKWDGFLKIFFTNFDTVGSNNPSDPNYNPNYGNPFVPVVGDTIRGKVTGTTATVAYVKQDSISEARVYFKNKSGDFKIGSTQNDTEIVEITTYTPLGGGADQILDMGSILERHADNANAGKMLVFDYGSNITPQATDTLFDLEYWLYKQKVIQGISSDSNPPTDVNNEWQRVYNIPIVPQSTFTGKNKEGYYAIYKKNASGFYRLLNGFTIADSDNFKHLGNKIKIVKGASGYTAIITEKGNNTFSEPGRIHFIDNPNGTDEWRLGADVNYKGAWNPNYFYYTGNFVIWNNNLYQAKTNIVPSAFDSSLWTLQTEEIDLVGYVPNDSGFTIAGGDSAIGTNNLISFGNEVSVSNTGDVLATTLKYGDQLDSALSSPKIAIYRLNQGRYQYDQLISAEYNDEAFATSVAVSNDGKLIAVGAPYNSVTVNNGGCVYIYKNDNGTFTLNQTIRGPGDLINERFGTKVEFDGNRLVVNSSGGDILDVTTFDGDKVGNAKPETTFDNNLTNFTTQYSNTGETLVYERINDTLIFGQSLNFDNLDFDSTITGKNVLFFGENLHIQNNHIYIGLPKLKNPDESVQGRVLDYRLPATTNIWTRHRVATDQVDLNKLKGSFLYNTRTKKFITYLDYIDPIQGKIAGPAEQELYYKVDYDPATYTNGTSGHVDVTNYDSDNLVGRLWWDIGAVRFLDPYSGGIINVSNRFNKKFDGTSVDIYEWVESKLLPSEWDAETDTESALAQGISGTSKYGDNAYSVKRVYNKNTGTFTNYYYYWVKNKKTTPDIDSRSISAFDVQQFIEAPEKQGYKFVNLLGDNKFSVHNCESLIEDKDVAINFRYWVIDNQNINIHNQYQLLTDNYAPSKPNKDVERKWFDSLIGFDEQERIVPDPDASPKEKYGILNVPRQSMFINRVEALKQVIERVNRKLKMKVMVDDFDLTPLSNFDNAPATVEGYYDKTVNSYAELELVNTTKKEQATLNPIIVNGRITDVLVDNPGRGYAVAPRVKITDSQGSGAEVELTINAIGSVTGVTMLKHGDGYSENTVLTVRKYSVLVSADENYNNRWSVYEFIGGTSPWNKTKGQKFDVRPFWSYADWYATGYNELTGIDHTIDQSYQLGALEDNLGDIVKINTVGAGGWLLLKKKDSQATSDYTVNYDTIGRQNATIQFSNSLYDYANSEVGFDGISYDENRYDLQPAKETRIILETLRDKLFVDELEVEYNQLFFASLRYLLSEQPFVDWLFKTSFIKAQHNVGELRKDITYNNDNLPSYQSYAEEVKPYKTKIREFVSNYEKIDTTGTTVTDFDLPQYYLDTEGKIVPQEITVSNNEFFSTNAQTSVYPSKHWLDNAGFEIEQINISNAGKGYQVAPIIKITGGGGTGATAIAYVGGGRVTGIKVTNGGYGYKSAPTITLEGSVGTTGIEAKASAQLGKGKARSFKNIIKFDRTTDELVFGKFDIAYSTGASTIQGGPLQVSTTIPGRELEQDFSGTGNKFVFDLKFPITLDKERYRILIKDNNNPLNVWTEVLQTSYTPSNVADVTLGRSRQKGRITFDTPPANNTTLRIRYQVDNDFLTYADRVHFLYEPIAGMPDKLFDQLMKGIDYGGVQVKSFDFGGGTGWSSDPYYTSAYDTYDTTYEDEVFRIDNSTKIFTFKKALETNVVYNVYKNNVRIDDPNYGTGNPVTNTNALMQSITGAGQTGISLTDDQTTTNLVVIDEEVIPTVDNDVIVIRKTTSDGSFIPDPRAYDTALSGGALNYGTATGLNAEDIVVDGDGFVTPTSSGGPEELVQGQVLDTLDMKVYDRIGEGGSIVDTRSYDVDTAGTGVFDFGVYPQSKEGIFVKKNNVILDPSAYTVNFRTKKITIPGLSLNDRINIITMSGNGEKILDMDQFTGDGSTLQYVTQVNWQEGLTSFVTVDGQIVDYVIETTDSTYDTTNKVAITFGASPAVGAVIDYMIYASESKVFSEIKKDNFTADGSTAVYTMSVTPFSSLPSTHNIIVETFTNANDRRVLNAGYNEQFTVEANKFEYQLRNWQQPGGTLGANDIDVYLNGKVLTYTSDFIFKPANTSVEIFENVANAGDILEIFVKTDGQYTINGNQLTLTTLPAIDTKVVVTHFSKHDIQAIERTNFDIVSRSTLNVGSKDDLEYKQLRNGLIKLRKQAYDTEFVWLVVNGKVLTPNVDYGLTNDNKFIRTLNPFADNDVVEIIEFATEGPITGKFGYRLFKDMLNRTVYKRLGDTNSYRLAKDLGVFDQEIVIDDASNLPTPDVTNNIPGIIFINAERIEYFVKAGNKLRQLRRGTLGTGVKELHKKGDELFNQGIDETIPYQDKLLVQNFTTTNSLVSGNYVEREYILDWNPASRNEMEVFLGGQRLTKGYLNSNNNAVKDIFHPTTGMDSPEGDITVTLPTYPQTWGLERDGFRVQYDSNTNSTKIYVYSLADGEKLTVIRKQGQLWNDIIDSTSTKSLGRSDNPIAQFIRAKEVKLPN